MKISGATKQIILGNFGTDILMQKDDFLEAMRRCDEGQTVTVPMRINKSMTMIRRGENDYKNVFAAIDKAGYTGYCGVEYAPLMDPIESLKKVRKSTATELSNRTGASRNFLTSFSVPLFYGFIQFAEKRKHLSTNFIYPHSFVHGVCGLWCSGKSE